MDCSTAKCYGRDLYPFPQGHQPRALTNWAIAHFSSRVEGGEFDPQSSQINDLQNRYVLLPSLALGIIRIKQALVISVSG